ncbi:MAG TPA: class I SAM-dependent methyltransferase [Myxococcales bacterium]|nr:class I SAM-dependent methyltransferase [Myxococcales bacterium]
MEDDRHGAKQPRRFDPAKASMLDDRARFESLPPAGVLAMLDIPRNGWIVDFGTGTGTYALEIAAARPDVTVVALDEQRAMLDRLSAKLAARPLPNVKVVLARTPAARALEGRADRVLALNVLHELGDDALRELAALLASAGRALFIDWNADVDRTAGPPREHVYSPDDAAHRLASFGFAVAERRLFRDQYGLLCAKA